MARTLSAAGSLAAVAATAHTLYNLRLLRRPATDPPPVHETVSILLPVRDEQSRVGPCLRALLEQQEVAGLEIVVLDDGSSDGTARVVGEVAAQDPRVRLVDGGPTPPPAGWLGKPWACQRLADTGGTRDRMVCQHH